jgi:hypothetical protein
MANKSAKDTTLQSTKQMLDELDVLMEQMLALPVNDPEETPAFPKEVVKSHALTASLTMLEAPAPFPESKPHPALNAPHLALPAAPTPLSNAVVPASLVGRMEPLLAEVPEMDAGATTLWIYQPLVWMNQAFDASTLLLGGVGAGLRTPALRMLMGLAGLAMLLVSAGWFLKDWLGWQW